MNLMQKQVYKQVMKMFNAVREHEKVTETFIMCYVEPEKEGADKINIVMAERQKDGEKKILKNIKIKTCQWYGFDYILDFVKEGVIESFLGDKKK